MKKQPYLYVIHFLSLILLVSMQGCQSYATYTDVSDQLPYRNLIGKHFIVLKDFYLYTFPGDSGAGLCPCGENGFPQALDKGKIGEKINKAEIVGIVPKNTEFTLMKIVRHDLVDHIQVTILIPTISISSQFNYVEASALQKKYTKSGVFEFDSDLVKEVSPSSPDGKAK
ncbi:MAG TPA: hypothetical protein DET40_21615 [Lentisphaeria bacterium]|nr:hypothetical protein [Lentisphaeria bacterium]